MFQFKDVFLGEDQRPYTTLRPAPQRWFEAGGKHNDLENVGLQARHQHFFEMLGNFSFGELFQKRKPITYAWEFSNYVLKLPKGKSYL